MVCVVTLMILIWCVSAGIWVIHTGGKFGCKKVTLFDTDCDDGLNTGIWVLHTGGKFGCKKVTLFDSDCDDGLNAGIWSCIQLALDIQCLNGQWHFLRVYAMRD